MDKRGIGIESIKNLDDIKQFPVLTKKDVLQAGDSIVSTKYPRWLMGTARTAGTTGTPMKICRSLFSIGDEHAFVRRQWDWASIGFADRCAWIVAGRRIAETNYANSNLYAYDPFMKELTLSAFHLTKETAQIYLAVMNRYKVKGIVGISSAVYYLAKVCLDSGVEVKLKTALTTSEALTQAMRSTIARAFNCRVFDFYGSAERVCYIHTCEQGSYHIIPEYGITELIPVEDSDKHQCKVVATGFWNLGMPLIRYDTGDIVVESNETCPCGRAFHLVKSINGRHSDLIKTPSGREYGPTILARVVKGANNILESQVVQDALDHICILYVPSEKFSQNDLFSFEKQLSYYLPSELTIDLKPVDAIPKTSSGKTKLIVSEI
jgi:phenylacetate-CoA ligase